MHIYFCCCCSVTKSSLTLCDPKGCSMPGFPVLYCFLLPESAQFQSIESVVLSNHLILCCPLLLLPSIFPSIRVFSSESVLCIRWPKHWSFSVSISPSSEYSGLISFRIDWSDLLVVQGTLKSLIQHHNSKASILWHSAFFMVQLSHLYMNAGKTIALAIWTFVSKVMPLLFNTLSRFVNSRFLCNIVLYSIGLHKKDLNDPDNNDGVITPLEPDILECEVRCTLGSITTNKASGGDEIPAELFQILKEDAMKVLHSICIHKIENSKKKIYFCFIDYTKAFNCVDHNKLQKILKERGIPDQHTCLLRNLYTGQEATARTRHGTMDWF